MYDVRYGTVVLAIIKDWYVPVERYDELWHFKLRATTRVVWPRGMRRRMGAVCGVVVISRVLCTMTGTAQFTISTVGLSLQ